MDILNRLRKIRLEINLLTEEYSEGNISQDDYYRILKDLKEEVERLNNLQIGSNFMSYLKNKLD